MSSVATTTLERSVSLIGDAPDAASVLPHVDSTPIADTPQPMSAAEVAALKNSVLASQVIRLEAISNAICERYADEGTRNLTIGLMCLADLETMKSEFERINSGTGTFGVLDFRNRVDQYRLEARLSGKLSIKENSIRVNEWVRSAALRRLVTKEIGEESANRVSFHEWQVLSAGPNRALEFSQKTLESAIRPGWFDAIRYIVDSRAKGVRLNAEDFDNLIVATEKRQDDLAKSADPAAWEKALAQEALNKRRNEVNRQKKVFGDAVVALLTRDPSNGNNAPSSANDLLSSFRASASVCAQEIDPLVFIKSSGVQKSHIKRLVRMIADTRNVEFLRYVVDLAQKSIDAISVTSDSASETEESASASCKPNAKVA